MTTTTGDASNWSASAAGPGQKQLALDGATLATPTMTSLLSPTAIARAGARGGLVQSSRSPPSRWCGLLVTARRPGRYPVPSWEIRPRGDRAGAHAGRCRGGRPGSPGAVGAAASSGSVPQLATTSPGGRGVSRLSPAARARSGDPGHGRVVGQVDARGHPRPPSTRSSPGATETAARPAGTSCRTRPSRRCRRPHVSADHDQAAAAGVRPPSAPGGREQPPGEEVCWPSRKVSLPTSDSSITACCLRAATVDALLVSPGGRMCSSVLCRLHRRNEVGQPSCKWTSGAVEPFWGIELVNQDSPTSSRLRSAAGRFVHLHGPASASR